MRIGHPNGKTVDVSKACLSFLVARKIGIRQPVLPFLQPALLSCRSISTTRHIDLESLLSKQNKSREERQLLWRAWTGLSEDAQATRLRLLESLLEALQTDEVRDARRLRSLLDSKHGQIDPQQRAFYSFWAHSLLQETDIAFEHFRNIPTDSQLFYKDIFMRRTIEAGDWTTGVKLWQLICEETNQPWTQQGKSIIAELLDSIPNVQTRQFMRTLSPTAASKLKDFARKELVKYLAFRDDLHAVELLLEAVTDGQRLADFEIAAVLRSLVRLDLAHEALDLFHQVTDSKTCPPVIRRMVNVALLACKEIDDITQLEKLLQNEVVARISDPTWRAHMQEPWTTAMAAYARRGSIEDVERLLGVYRSTGQKPDIFMIGTLLEAYVVRLEVTKARKFFESCEAEYGFKPDRAMYNMLLNMYATTLDVNSAQSTFEALKSAGFEPDEYTAATLIDLYAQRKDPEGAQKAFDDASGGITPNIRMYGALMNAYVESDDLAGMRKVARLIEVAEIKPNSAIMNILLKGLLEDDKEPNVLLRLVADMTQLNIKANAHTNTLLLQAYTKHRQLDEATALFESMLDQRVPPNEHHYTIMMVAHLRQGDFESTKEYYDNMRANGIQPSQVTQAVLLNAYMLQGSEESQAAADNLLSTLTRPSRIDRSSTHVPRPAPSPDLFTTLINQPVHTYSPQRAQEIFALFMDYVEPFPDAKPDIRILTAIMNSFKVAGQLDQVLQLFEKVKSAIDEKYKGSSGARHALAVPLSLVFSALDEAGQAGKAESYYKRVLQDGYELDDYNWNQYVCLQLSTNPTAALDLLESDRPVQPRTQHAVLQYLASLDADLCETYMQRYKFLTSGNFVL